MGNSLGALHKVHWSFASIKIKDIDIILASFLFFDPTGGNNNALYSLLKYCIITYLFCKYIQHYRKTLVPASLLLIFSILMFYSTWINTHNVMWSFSGFMFGCGIIAVLLTFVDACGRLSIRIALKRVLIVFATLLFFNDLLMIIFPYNHDDSSTVYLLGNKFIVSYAHCLLSGLMLVCFEKKTALNRVVILFGTIMSYFAGSTTGAIMMVIMLALTFLPSKIKTLISNPLMLVVAIAILNALIWGTTNLFKMPEVQNFVVNVLHKSPDMTGRDRLYAATLDFVAMKPVLGWGYLTDIYRITFGYGNAQNGLFHLITQCGILGAVVYFSGLFFALIGRTGRSSGLFGIYAFLFAMAVGSSVEINLSFQFAFGVALICGAFRGNTSMER